MRGICLHLLRYLTMVASIALALSVTTTAMADLITLKLPGIRGGVTAEGQQGTIEVLSLTGNIQVPVTGSAGVSRTRRGRPNFSDLMIRKRLDRSSLLCSLPQLREASLKVGLLLFSTPARDGLRSSLRSP